MKCVVCKRGETREGRTTVTLELDGAALVVREVPVSRAQTRRLPELMKL